MKLSEALKSYADYYFKYRPDENFELLSCNDIYEIALMCVNKHGYFYYDVCTLRSNQLEFLACYFDDRKSSEDAYNLLLEFSKIRYKGD